MKRDYFEENEELYGEMTEEERKADEFLMGLGQIIRKAEERPCIINFPRFEEVIACWRKLCCCFVGTDVKLSLSIGGFIKSMACISIEGEDFIFEKPQMLAGILPLCDNVDIYPKVDGTVVMDITFHKMTVPLE